MPRRKKKSFIDKNNCVTFQVVSRGPDDPLFGEESAPPNVLIEKKSREKVYLDDEPEIGNNFGDSPLQGASKPTNSKQKASSHREEQIKYGIYFDDDYNYLQHLLDLEDIEKSGGDLELEPKIKNIKEKKLPKLMLPSSVFDSNVQVKEDLNKKAALPVGPQLDWDPDVVEAMDDDFDYEDPNNQIDDDFIQQAMGINTDDVNDVSDDNLSICGYNGSEDEFEGNEESMEFGNNVDYGSKFRNFAGIHGANDVDNCTVKTSASTHFTDYSISSSMLPRNEILKTLDEKFEQMYIKEYSDEMAIGALDCEPIDGGDIDPNHCQLMDRLCQEYEDFKSGKALQYQPNPDSVDYVRKYLKNDDNGQINGDSDSDEDGDEECEEIEIVDPGRKGDRDRFDCESILSTMSNTLYRPKILNDFKNHIRIDPRTGVPKPRKECDLNDRLDSNKSTKSDMSRLSELSVRPKNETSEQRRERKKELKEYRQQRRMEKKANRLAFQEEKQRLHKIGLNEIKQKNVTNLI